MLLGPPVCPERLAKNVVKIEIFAQQCVPNAVGRFALPLRRPGCSHEPSL